MTLGEKLRHFRKLIKKSQQNISEDTGIPQTTLSGWENNIGEPGVSDIKKLAKALGVSVMDLIGDDEQCQSAAKEAI